MTGLDDDQLSELRGKYPNAPAGPPADGSQIADAPPLPPLPSRHCELTDVEERSAAVVSGWQPQPHQMPQPQPHQMPHPQPNQMPHQMPTPQPQPHQMTTPQPQPHQMPPPQQRPSPQQWRAPTQLDTGSWTAPPRVLHPGEASRSERIGGRVEGAQRGWRATVNRLFHTRLPKGADEIDYDNRVSQIQRALRETKTIGVISGKGSAGKTAVSLGMGAGIASKNRGMKVAALSIDPMGNLTERVRSVNDQPPQSVMSLAAESDDELKRASVVSTYLLTDRSGLRVLGSSICDRSDFLTPDGFNRALAVINQHFNLSILDFGLNVDSPTYHAGLAAVDQLILVASTTPDSIDEMHRLIATLRAFGGKYAELIPNAVVVFNQTRPGKTNIDIGKERSKVTNTYGTPVITIPFDAHISEGGPMALDLMDAETQLRYVWLAAEVMKKLPAD